MSDKPIYDYRSSELRSRGVSMLVYPSTPISPGKQEAEKSIFGKIVVLVVGSKAASMQFRGTLDPNKTHSMQVCCNSNDIKVSVRKP